jgi:deazaflavin-dependent oxidoreductase (nitroreductase family)
MNLRNRSVFVAGLTTIGRSTGLPRPVELRMVCLDGRFYTSSSSIQKKHWCRNLVKNPNAEVSVDGAKFRCRVRQVTDEKLRRQVLTLRDSPPMLDRVVFEMTPNNPPAPSPAGGGGNRVS